MKRNIPILICLCCLMVIGDARVSGQTKPSDFSSISKAEIELLLVDVAKTNPKILEKLAKDPAAKKKQIEDLKQLLAYASQAQREGLASDPTNKQEMDNIRAETIAVNYDREINKDKASMPAFGYITDEQVKAYWDEKETIGLAGSAEQRTHEVEFKDFLNAKIAILKTGDPGMKDREISDDERTQARDVFARIRIYKAEYGRKIRSGEMSKGFVDKVNLTVKLQQAQFLARLYSEKIVDRTRVTDVDIAKYIAVHPELDPSKKKVEAHAILDRAQAGENFAALANKFSDDPGNKGANGEAHGGLYKDVPRGRMLPPFEEAALALRPGQISPQLVETDFGFHIIKLERKGTAPTETYDVRHILISTGHKDPDDTTAREIPIKDYVRSKLEKDKEEKILDEIVAANNIQAPEDFTIPEVGSEPAPKAVKKVPVSKKRPVTKPR